MNRSLVIVMLFLLAGTGVGAYWVMNGGGNPFAKGNGKHKVEHEPAPPMVVAIGLVDGERTVSKPVPLVQGRVIEVAAEGTTLKKGDAILKIDDGMYKASAAEAQAALDESQERLKQARDMPQQYELKQKQQTEAIAAAKAEEKAIKLEQDQKLEQAKNAEIKVNKLILEALEERLKQLGAKVKAEQFKLDELKLFKPESEIKRAEADVAAKQAQLDKAKWALNQCTLEAPSAGLVLRVAVSPGEVIVAGLPGQAPPIQFLPDGPKVIRAEILQEWAALVLIGQKVEIEDDVFQGPVWKGRVKSLSHWFAEKRHRIIEPFMLNDVRTLECLIEVEDESPPLRIGQRVRVKIKTK